jgi:hypothetical protein
MQADPKLCIARQMYRKTKDVTNNCSGKCTEKPKMLRTTVVENVQKNQRCYE